MYWFWLYLFWFSTYVELNIEREKKVAKQYIHKRGNFLPLGVQLNISREPKQIEPKPKGEK